MQICKILAISYSLQTTVRIIRRDIRMQMLKITYCIDISRHIFKNLQSHRVYHLRYNLLVEFS